MIIRFKFRIYSTFAIFAAFTLLIDDVRDGKR